MGAETSSRGSLLQSDQVFTRGANFNLGRVCAELASPLCTCRHLHLDCKIGHQGASSIARALEVNKSLVSLNLNDNEIGNEGATNIAGVLELNKSLVSLDISSNAIGSEGATIIGRALESNKSLVSLDISANNIGNEGTTSIARALELNKSLVYLNISWNSIGSKGATIIAGALELNKSLVSLDIRRNSIGSEGATTIARALELNKSLVSLDLLYNEIGNNKIGSEGATNIARALELNKSLVSLNISHNKIGSEGARSIARALELNKTLVSLDISRNDIGSEGETIITRALESNKSPVSPNLGEIQLFWFTWVIHPTLGASLLAFLQPQTSAFSCPSVGGTKYPLSWGIWLVSGGPENTLSDALFEIPIEIFDSQNRPPRTHPNAMAVATGKEYFDCNFTKSPTSSAQTRSTMPETPVEEIPQHNQQPFPDSSMTSAPVENTQTAPTSLHSPNLSLPFAQRSSAASKLGTPSQSPETLTSEIPATNPPPAATTPRPSLPSKPPTVGRKPESNGTPFQIETANSEQTCCWLESVGVDDDCLKIIRANKLRGRTLANYSVQQLCDLGLVIGDAEFIVDEVKAHLSSRCQEQSSHSSLIKSTVGAEPLFGAEMSYKCFAFVVGNESYGNRSLKNSINDAESICEFLKNKCQFEVVCHKNIRNLDVFTSNLRKFKETLLEQKIAGNKVASIFYFAGHGRQVEGHNFLLMTCDETAFEETSYGRMELKAPMFGTVIDEIKSYSDLTIGILDACRLSKEKSATASRGFGISKEPLLAKEEDFRAGCFLIYPTSPGKGTQDVCALPNRKNHGFFTGCFLEVVENAEPGTSWNDVESAIIQMVQTQSHGKQTPWVSKSSGLRFALF
ncbi:Protein NLRC3 [Pelomyxa schiedti]|nr:Protein NLRC3 [Pelomyxa schiedti]